MLKLQWSRVNVLRHPVLSKGLMLFVAVNAVNFWLNLLQSWKTEQQDRTTVAVSAGNKAFIHWSSVGTEKKEGLTTKMYGLKMLVFNEQCKISEILVLRQPLESQKAELFGSTEE